MNSSIRVLFESYQKDQLPVEDVMVEVKLCQIVKVASLNYIVYALVLFAWQRKKQRIKCH